MGGKIQGSRTKIQGRTKTKVQDRDSGKRVWCTEISSARLRLVQEDGEKRGSSALMAAVIQFLSTGLKPGFFCLRQVQGWRESSSKGW